MIIVKGLVNPSRSLRQGDPISLYLFLLCAEAFSSLVTKVVEEKSLHRVKISRTVPQLSHLLFVDDSVLFVRANTQECKRLLILFHVMNLRQDRELTKTN